MKIKKCNSLAEIREQIDMLDNEIIKLLSSRYMYIKEAAKFKANEDAVRAPDRVQQVINKVRMLAKQASLPPIVAESVYRVMIGQFIELELEEHNSK